VIFVDVMPESVSNWVRPAGSKVPEL
jgi:hypothetical protein